MQRSTKRFRRHRNPQGTEEKRPLFFSKKLGDNIQNGNNQPFFQTKLQIGQPGDKYEREADAVAERVTNNSSNNVNQSKISPIPSGGLKTSQRKKSDSGQEKRTQLKIQRQAELDEEPLQKQEMEEEEPVQMVEEEEENMQMMQSEEEDEVQMQEEEEEELQMQQEEEEDSLQMEELEEEEVQTQEEEEELQMKSDSASPLVHQKLGSIINASSGRGSPLPEKPRREMEIALGTDLKEVNIHTDPDAVEMNKAMGAQAFTHGKDIYFNAGKFRPEEAKGKRLLAHELTHVIQQGAVKNHSSVTSNRVPSTTTQTVSRQGLLTPAQELTAIAFNNSRYDSRSKHIIQNTVGVGVDGIIGPITVEGIATFQQNNGLPENGQVDLTTLNSMVRSLATDDFHEHAIQLVVDFHNMNVSDVLSIRHDPALLLPTTNFESGNLRVIRLGNFSFLSEGVLRASLLSQLGIPAPAAAPLGPLPNHLNSTQEASAIFFNKNKFRDKRSIRAIQGLVGANPDGVFGQDTVERIAEFQNSNVLTVDGKVGEQSLRSMVAQLDTNNEQNAAIRMIMDFYRISEHGALLDIHFDPGLTTSNATTGGIIPGPSIVKIGPPAFAQGFAGLVHTIAHELEHVRQRKVGILNQDLREFLGERIEILSIGMPEEDIDGFFDDARRALFHWNRLPANEQRTHFARFTEVRNKVRQRFNAALAADQATHQATLDNYNAVVRP